MNVQIRPATQQDTLKVQELRKIGWQDNYINEESGVTKELLINKLASLPVPQTDIDYFNTTISQEQNKEKNLVAILEGEIVGVVMYSTLSNGNGDIGVFIARNHRGNGIGTLLLQELIKRTNNTLEVTIFSKNRSRNLYKKCGFVEVGGEEKHYFDNEIYLPIQKLVLQR